MTPTGLPDAGELVSFLGANPAVPTARLVRWKTVYRPYICPIDAILALIPSGSRVGDIGCGGGALLACVAGFRHPESLLGLEVDADSLTRARDLLAAVAGAPVPEWQAYDGERFPVGLHACDVVLLIDVLHHVPPDRHGPFLQAVFDAMRPGAVLILKEIDAGRRLLVWFNRLHDWLLAGARGDERTADEIRTMLQAVGFTTDLVARQRLLVYPHVTLRAIKP